MPEFTKRDKQAAKEIHRLFRQAWFQDPMTFIIWAATRPLSMLVYNVLIPFQVAYCLQAIITKNFDSVTRYASSVLVLAVIYCVLWGVGGVAIIKNAKKGLQYVQREVFKNYLSKDYEFLNNAYLGSLGSQATRLRECLDEYDQILFNGFTNQIIIILSSIIIVGYHSIALAAITLVAMMLVLSFTIIITRWRIKYRRLLSEASSETAGVLSDALTHGATVKSFAAENYELIRLNKTLSKLADVQYRSWATSIPADIGRMLLAATATFLLLIMTSSLYHRNSISIAIVILVQLYVVRLILATQTIADLIKSYEATMSSAHQAVKTMLIKNKINDPKKPKHISKKDIKNLVLDNVCYAYDDAPAGVEAIKKFNLVIEQGEKIGFVGYSGSGKTTLTKLLLRFTDVTEGKITISGVDVRDLTQKELRSLIAYVPQEPLLFHRSIYENITYGKPNASKAAALQAGKTAFVDEFAEELVSGYDTLVGEKGIKLSGGQRQRVAIARALLKNAPILVLDEATSALDSRSEKYIQKALWELMKDRTTLVIAHRLSTIQQMDRIVVMDKGKIMEVGDHEHLLKKGGIYAKLWAHQSGGYIGAKSELVERSD